MFEVNIKINGNTIIHIYGHNEECVETYTDNKKDRDKYVYHYQVYEVDKCKLKTSSVVHNRKEGMLKLIELIIQDYQKRNKNEHHSIDL